MDGLGSVAILFVIPHGSARVVCANVQTRQLSTVEQCPPSDARLRVSRDCWLELPSDGAYVIVFVPYLEVFFSFLQILHHGLGVDRRHRGAPPIVADCLAWLRNRGSWLEPKSLRQQRLMNDDGGRKGGEG